MKTITTILLAALTIGCAEAPVVQGESYEVAEVDTAPTYDRLGGNVERPACAVPEFEVCNVGPVYVFFADYELDATDRGCDQSQGLRIWATNYTDGPVYFEGEEYTLDAATFEEAYQPNAGLLVWEFATPEYEELWAIGVWEMQWHQAGADEWVIVHDMENVQACDFEG